MYHYLKIDLKVVVFDFEFFLNHCCEKYDWTIVRKERSDKLKMQSVSLPSPVQ